MLPTRMLSLISAALFVAAVSVAVLAQQQPDEATLQAAAGYKAKVLASAIFVSGIEPERAEREDLAPLPGLDRLPYSVDRDGRRVTVLDRSARCRERFGCTLLPVDGEALVELPAPKRIDERKRFRWKNGEPNAALDRAVAAAFAEPDPERPRLTRAIVVVHRDRIVAERYAEGIGPETPLNGWSMTKSVMNALAGILVERGALERQAPLGLAPEGDPRAAITLDHLLRMNSGLAFNENYTDPAGDVGQMLFVHGDTGGFARNRPVAHAPGTRWSYSSGTSNILSGVLRERAGSDGAYVALAHEALFGRLGMRSAVLEPDASGTFVGSSMMFASARDWARFGRLYLRDGVWQGKRLLAEGWVAYTLTPTPGSGGRYGAHFWINGEDERGRRPYPGLPADYFRASGFQGQVVGIVPSEELIVVRLGMTNHDNWSQRTLMRAVIAAL